MILLSRRSGIFSEDKKPEVPNPDTKPVLPTKPSDNRLVSQVQFIAVQYIAGMQKPRNAGLWIPARFLLSF